MASPLPHRHQCSQCIRTFSRADHLKRHQLCHSGLKPHSCIFCHWEFSRADSLYSHYKDCPNRQGREIPPSRPKGRRRHACLTCITMKRRCDGANPCKTCQSKNLGCVQLRPEPEDANLPDVPQATLVSTSLGQDDQVVEGSIPTESRDSRNVNRLSIHALLVSGRDSFTEDFNLPCASPLPQTHVQDFEFEGNQTRFDVLQDHSFFSWYDTISSNLASGNVDHLDLFGNLQIPLTGTYGHFGDVYHNVPAISTELPLSYSAEYFGQDEDPCVVTLKDAMVRQLQRLDLDETVQKNMMNEVHFLITTVRIKKFTSLYFQNWHPNSPIIHVPSFDWTNLPTTLLGAMAFVGAMYSRDPLESALSRKLLDLVELVVFGSTTFSYEQEIAASWTQTPESPQAGFQWSAFQNLQAAYIMVTVQYWAGSRTAKDRALERRFCEVAKVCRQLGLTKIRHLPQDRISESRWIRKECSIRTMCMIRLLDCAFRIYSNYPCRFTQSELEFDLPCQNSFYAAEHPFAADEFSFNPKPTAFEALKSLLRKQGDQAPFARSSRPKANTEISKHNLDEERLTVIDLFLLIHLLFILTLEYTGLLAVSGTLDEYGTSFFRSSGSNSPSENGDSIAAAIMRALGRWQALWQKSCKESPNLSWEKVGMYKNGLHFWLVLQLLVSEKRSVELAKNLEVNCNDTLARFQTLLREDAG